MTEKRHRSFYANVLDEAERLELKAASAIEGIDEEIALIRLRIKALATAEDIDDLTRCMTTLARLVSTKFNVTKHDKKGLKEAFANVLRDIALPLGIGIGINLPK